MTLRGVVDFCNYVSPNPVPNGGYPGGEITDDMVRGWIGDGYTHAVIGSQWPVIAQHQIEVCSRNGMTIDLYHWLYFNRNMADYLNERKFLSDNPQVLANYLDCEDDVGGLGPTDVVMRIGDACSIMDSWGKGLTGIYTGEWWWPSRTGDSKAFSARRLFHAAYPKTTPTLDQAKDHFGSWITYGGWSRPTIWQYAGSVSLHGGNVDLGVLETSSPQMPSTPPVLQWTIRQEGYFATFYYGSLPVYRLGSTDGLHQGRISRLRGDQWYWDRSDPQTGHIYQSLEEGD